MAPENALTRIQESVHNGAFEYRSAYDPPALVGHSSGVTHDEAVRILGKAFNAYQDDNALMRDPHQWWVNGNTAAGKPVSICVELDEVNPKVVLVGTRSLPWSG
jgi:hypothetical protein